MHVNQCHGRQPSHDRLQHGEQDQTVEDLRALSSPPPPRSPTRVVNLSWLMQESSGHLKSGSDLVMRSEERGGSRYALYASSVTSGNQDTSLSSKQGPSSYLDASAHVHNQGNTFNITGQSAVHFEYGPRFNGHSVHFTLDPAIQNLVRSYNAEYDMTVNASRGPCTPHTRTAVIEKLMEWCRSGVARVYWMSGMTGTGKTTIAYSYCQMLASENLLGASFFCSRSLPDCRDINIIIPTIAFQLARRYAPFGEALAQVLHNDSDIVRRGLDSQLHNMIINPWAVRKDDLPSDVIVALDALDECDEHHSKFLQVIFRNITLLPFKLMVTSRPEYSIRRVLLAKDPNTLSTFILHEVEESSVKEDIARYIESELKERLPSCSRSDILRLAAQCDTFFIYAATFCRFITDDEGDELARLRSLLDLSYSDTREKAIEPIDELYKQILERVLSDKKPRSEVEGIKSVLDMIIHAREPLKRDAIASLLQLSLDELDSRLKLLRSFIFVPEALDQPLTTFHASFADFMLASSRSGRFHCQPHTSHLDLTGRCLTLMKCNLRRNLCQLVGRPPNKIINRDVITQYISNGLRYASVYWAEHWTLSSHHERQAALGSIHNFLSTGALHWFECLSLIGRLAVSVETLEMLQDMFDENAGLANITYEHLRFIQHAYESIEYSAMETYFSALSWIPIQSPLRILYHTFLCNQVPQVLCGLPTTWTGPDQIIHIPSDTIESIAVSRDGRYIVSGSRDRSVYMWNVGSHIKEGALSHDAGFVCAVAISADGSRVVSGSWDRGVYIWNRATHQAAASIQSVSNNCEGIYAVAISSDDKWIASGDRNGLVHVLDAANGHLVHTHQWHTDTVRSLSFIDGTRFVSGSEDRTARICNVVTRKTECILRGHTHRVLSVACSPSGDKIITGSSDSTSRLWDMSGKELHVLRGHSYQVNCVAFMSDGSQVVSGSNDKTLRVWDVASGDTVHVLTGPVDAVTSIAAFCGGLKIVSSSGKTISIWVLRGGDCTGGKEENDEASLLGVGAGSVAFSADGRAVMLLPSLHIHDTMTLKKTTALGSDDIGYHCGALSLSGRTVSAVGRQADGLDATQIKVWQLTGDGAVADHFILEGHTHVINSLAFSHHERQLISSSSGKTARVWDIATRKCIRILKHPHSVNTAAFSHDDTQIVSVALYIVHVWNVHTGELLHNFFTGAHSISRPNDCHIITSYKTSIKINNTETSRLQYIHRGYRYWTIINDQSSYALSEDDQWICYSPRLSDRPRRLLWIPPQYRPNISEVNITGPLFTSTSRGIQVCLPRTNGLITLLIPHNI